MDSDKIIIVNARFLCTHATGVQRFAFEISRYLKKIDKTIKFVSPSNIMQVAWAQELEAKIIGRFQGHIWEQYDLAQYMKKIPNSILFSPGNTGPLTIQKQMVVLHDIAFLTNPSTLNWKFRLSYRCLMKLIIKNVARIITVSSFSSKEICSFYPEFQEKIHVVYNGVTHFPRNLSPYTGDSYFLVVSSLDPRKNIPFIIQSYATLPVENRPLLKIVGQFGTIFKKEKFRKIPPGVEFIGDVSDYTLAQLYSNAKALLFPSIYEGFGLPAIEAMSFGTPCIVSDIPVLREILQDAAIYLNSYDHKAWNNNMINILKDDDLRSMLKEKGLIRSQKFNWEVSARQIYEHLKSI